MTLIEIFSGSPIENFISTLALKPQKTIFVAPDTKKYSQAEGFNAKWTP